MYTFGGYRHLVSVVFSEHSNIMNLGLEAFGGCYALTSITLPDKLEVIEPGAFSDCSALERVFCNRNPPSMPHPSCFTCNAK